MQFLTAKYFPRTLTGEIKGRPEKINVIPRIFLLPESMAFPDLYKRLIRYTLSLEFSAGYMVASGNDDCFNIIRSTVRILLTQHRRFGNDSNKTQD